ncbi:MAG: hypothetical protein JWO41_67 [Candidatus Saccharibacteria bacterium]|nr:hypothetical protein [Candidatus Saccharibacteria bacterium]
MQRLYTPPGEFAAQTVPPTTPADFGGSFLLRVGQA